MRTSTLFGAKNFVCFGIYVVSVRTSEEEELIFRDIVRTSGWLLDSMT